MALIKNCKVQIYTTPGDPNKVASFYEVEMRKLGWELYNKQTMLGNIYGLIFKKGKQGVAIGITKSLTGTVTHIGIVNGIWIRALQAWPLTIIPI